MRILLMGNKNRAVVCLEALLAAGHDVVGVVGHPDSKIEDWYPSLPAVASDRGRTVHQPENVNDPAFVETAGEMDPELIVMAGYSQILHEEILGVPTEGVLNLHGGKLPEYRGASTLNWMLIEGETEGGIAIIFADETIDAGDVVLQETFEIAPDDTIVDVIETTDDLFPPMLVEAVASIEDGTVERTPQSRSRGAYYHSRRPRDGEIDWERHTAEDVSNLVRALAGPYPGAFTTLDGETLVVHEASPLDEEVRGVSGRVALRRPGGVVVVAADRGVLVETVEPAAGPTQDANEFFDRLGVDLGT